MRIQTNKSNKKVFVIIATILALLLISLSAAYYFKVGPFSPNQNDSVNLDPATEDQKTTGNDIKQSSLDQINAGKENTGSDPSPAPQPVEGSDKKSVGMEITAANQTDTTLQVRTFIQTVTNNGSCNLSMTNTQGATYTAAAGVQALSSTTTCKGFDIPLSQLAPGVWTITIDFSNDSLIATISKEVTIK
jgi:hypothetical protein